MSRFLAHASDGNSVSLDDMAYFNGLRRKECKRANGQYSLGGSVKHKLIGGFSLLLPARQIRPPD